VLLQTCVLPRQKNSEVFVKMEFNKRGKDLVGIIWLEDSVLHRRIARKASLPVAQCIVRSRNSVDPRLL
jgi:hypothetical protein